MELAVHLPLSETVVRLILPDSVAGDSRYFPPVFRTSKTTLSTRHSPLYEIHLAVDRSSPSICQRLIVNYRDLVHIYEEGDCLRVELADAPALDRPVLANMGISGALCHILCREQIFLLHAASIVHGKQGFLFPGRSNSGKTTLCRISSQRNLVLCDELSSVTAGGGGSTSDFSVFSGPRWSAFTFQPEFYRDDVWQNDSLKVFPLQAVLFPGKAEVGQGTRLLTLNPIEAAMALVHRFMDTAYVKILPAADQRQAFHFFSRLAREIPCYAVYIDLQTDFWKVIDDAFQR